MNVGDYIYDPGLQAYGIIVEKLIPSDAAWYYDILWDDGDCDYAIQGDVELVFDL